MSSLCQPALSPIFHSKKSPHDASVLSSLPAADLCLPSHSPVFVCITALYIILLSLSPCPHITVLVDWAQNTKLPPFYFLWPFFSRFLFDVILFCLGRYKIHSLVRFFSLGLFFGIPVFRDSFLAICRTVLIYLVLVSGLFWGLSLFSDSVDFSFSKGSFFLIFSGLFCGSSSTALFLIVVLFFLVLRI